MTFSEVLDQANNISKEGLKTPEKDKDCREIPMESSSGTT